ncbi:MAG: hypothetical protein KKA75_04850 [Proteobacteria bacterium]|nr:hypothetical protein [Pseudomonadota bacterium]
MKITYIAEKINLNQVIRKILVYGKIADKDEQHPDGDDSEQHPARGRIVNLQDTVL